MAKRRTHTPSAKDPYTNEGDEGTTGSGRSQYTPSNTDPYTNGVDKGQTYKVDPDEAVQRTHRDRK